LDGGEEDEDEEEDGKRATGPAASVARSKHELGFEVRQAGRRKAMCTPLFHRRHAGGREGGREERRKGGKEDGPAHPLPWLHLQDLPPEEPVALVLSPETALEVVGVVSSCVNKLLVIASGGGKSALDMGSILWLADRRPVGRVFEVFGPVVNPFYVVRFNSDEELQALQVKAGVRVCVCVSMCVCECVWGVELAALMRCGATLPFWVWG
jgi:H/ACA ribonucleoprotein complex non-core subunit NAF1